MRRATLCVVPAVIVVLLVAAGAQASSKGWVGSRYSKQDCNHVSSAGRPGLYCERWFAATFQSTQTMEIADERCAGRIRVVSRTGTIAESFKGYDFYNGPVPIAKFAIVGNEVNYTYSWIAYTDTDLGCL